MGKWCDTFCIGESMLTIRLFGKASFVLDDCPLKGLTTRKPESFLGLILLRRNQPWSRRELSATLWPEDAQDTALNNLRVLLHRLRQEFPRISDYFALDRHVLRWNPTKPYWLDVQEVDTLLAAPPTLEHIDCLLELYQGRLLEGGDERWLLSYRRQSERRFIRFLQEALRYAESQNDLERSLRCAERWLELAPGQEQVWQEIMRLHALRGEQHELQDLWQRCVDQLFRGFRREPSRELRHFYDSLRSTPRPTTLPALSGDTPPPRTDPSPEPASAPGLTTSEPAQTVLQLAALLTGPLHDSLLEALIPDENTRLDGLESLCTHHILTLESPGSYVFTRPALQAQVLASMSAPRQCALHRRIAEALEQRLQAGEHVPLERIIHHYDAGGRAPLSARHLMELGRQAYRREELEEARRLYEQAHAHLLPDGPPAQQIEALLAQAQLSAEAGKKAQMEQELERLTPLLIQLSDTRPVEMRIALMRAQVCVTRGDVDLSLLYSRQAEMFAEAVGDLKGKAEAILLQAHALIFLSRLEEALPLAELSYQLARSLGDTDMEQLALTNQIYMQVQLLDLTAARKSAEQMLTLAETLRSDELLASALQRCGSVHMLLGNLSTSIAYLERSCVHSQDCSPLIEVDTRLSLVRPLVQAHEFIRATEILEDVARSPHFAQLPVMRQRAALQRGIILRECGQFEEAHRVLTDPQLGDWLESDRLSCTLELIQLELDRGMALEGLLHSRELWETGSKKIPLQARMAVGALLATALSWQHQLEDADRVLDETLALVTRPVDESSPPMFVQRLRLLQAVVALRDKRPLRTLELVMPIISWIEQGHFGPTRAYLAYLYGATALLYFRRRADAQELLCRGLEQLEHFVHRLPDPAYRLSFLGRIPGNRILLQTAMRLKLPLSPLLQVDFDLLPSLGPSATLEDVERFGGAAPPVYLEN